MIDSNKPADLVILTVCDLSNINCAYNRCNTCKDSPLPVVMDPATKNNIVRWNEWVTKRSPYSKKSPDGTTTEVEGKHTALETKAASLEKLVEQTKKDLPRFKVHLFNIAHQFREIRQLKERLVEDEVVVHFDYSENYNCKWSKEIKDTHFGGGHKQVTLHMGVLYVSEGQPEAFATVSSSLKHDAVATWAHWIQCGSI